MGVFGLWSHLFKHKDDWCERIDLLDVAKERGEIELLVDYYAFQQHLMNKFWDGLCHCSGNYKLPFLGGEYGAIDYFVRELVDTLKKKGINFVMFVDGAKGSSIIGTQQKLDTWQNRHFRDLDRLQVNIDILQGEQSPQSLGRDMLVRPVLLEVQIFETLKQCDVEMVFRSGEADFVLAHQLQTRPKAYGILSNDSDFFIFQNCRVIVLSEFDLDNDLGIGGSSTISWVPQDPPKLTCGIATSERIAEFLGLDEHKQLIDLSIIVGNDFTTSYIRQLKIDMRIRGRTADEDVQKAVRLIQQQGCLDNCQIYAKQLQKNKSFRESVQRSREFYTLSLPADEMNFKGVLTKMLNDGVENGQFPSTLLSMHHNFYWYRLLLEDCEQGTPSCEESLHSLRSYIYRIILPPQEKTVVEYGRTAWTNFSSAGVFASNNTRIPYLDQIDVQKVFHNLRSINMILLHQEFDRSRGGRGLYDHKGHAVNFFDRYGRRNGFLCLLLRYFLVLNWQMNLCISMEEWLAIIALVFAKTNRPWYCGLNLTPSLRGITILNWFQNLYRYAYQFLGSIFHVNNEFPQPKELFSGAVFCAFYALCTRQLPPNMANERSEQIKSDFNFIIGEKRHLIKFLLDGHIEFNTSFGHFFR